MKKAVKLFGLVVVSVVLFSCSTDEHDSDLEKAIQLSENIEQMQSREGDVNFTDSISSVDGTPIIITKRD